MRKAFRHLSNIHFELLVAKLELSVVDFGADRTTALGLSSGISLGIGSLEAKMVNMIHCHGILRRNMSRSVDPDSQHHLEKCKVGSAIQRASAISLNTFHHLGHQLHSSSKSADLHSQQCSRWLIC